MRDAEETKASVQNITNLSDSDHSGCVSGVIIKEVQAGKSVKWEVLGEPPPYAWFGAGFRSESESL